MYNYANFILRQADVDGFDYFDYMCNIYDAANAANDAEDQVDEWAGILRELQAFPKEF